VRCGYTGLPSRDAWHPAALATPLNYPRAESTTSWQAPRRQDSESDLLRREFFELSHDWGRTLEEIDQVHTALDTWHPSTPHNYQQAESTTSRQAPRHRDSEGAIHHRLFFEPSHEWGPMLEELDQVHAALDEGHPASTPPRSHLLRQAPRHRDSEGAIHRRLFFEPSHEWGPMLEELDQVHAALDAGHPASTPPRSHLLRQAPLHQDSEGAIHRRLFFEPSHEWGPMLEELGTGVPDAVARNLWMHSA
jgi:hypothetical protein